LKELAKRSLVALIGIPIILLAIYFGEIYFTISLMFLSSLTLSEYYTIIENKGAKPNNYWGILFNNIFFLLVYLGFHNDNFNQWLLASVIIFIIGSLSLQLLFAKNNAIINIATTIDGIEYISIFFISLLLIREFEYFFPLKYTFNAMQLVYSFIISIWICDTAAYFVGSKYGKHKLLPNVSPKKSWEGAIAGFLGATASMILINYLFSNLSIINSLLLGVIVGIAGQIGDLAESQLKRDAGVKDSSAMLPGHGGFLDRFDSILFVSPLILVFLLIFNP